MDFNENSPAEGLKETKEKKVTDDAIVLVIRGEEDDPTFSGQASPEIMNLSPSSDRPPKIPSVVVEQEEEYGDNDDDDDDDDYNEKKEGEEEEEEKKEENEIEEELNKRASSRKKLKFWVLIEWIALVCITGTLISSLTIRKLERRMILELHLWKWCVLLLVIVCGRLFTVWFINVLVFLIQTFSVTKKVLYFVNGLKKSVQVCIWLGLVLLSWVLLFHGRIKRSDNTNKILNSVTKVLVSLLVGDVIWLLKTILILILAASVNVNSFFDRIRESLCHQHLLQTLSGNPMRTSVLHERVSRMREKYGLDFNHILKDEHLLKDEKDQGQEVIDVVELQKMKQDEVSPWTMKLLSNVISSTRLSITFRSSSTGGHGDDGANPTGKSSKKYDILYVEEEGRKENMEINSELDAKIAAYRIFKNVATEPGSKFIFKDDLQKFFFSNKEPGNVMSLFDGALAAGKIKKSMLKKWVLRALRRRKSLMQSLKDAQTAVEQLDKVVTILVLAVIVIVWLIAMGLATTEVLLFIASQIFIFGNTTKAVFEGIIFVFLTHPFDVGDHCVIDGVQMIVEEINIMRTGFLRYDNQKIYYPNAVLATKCIANMHRSPDMSDVVEFTIDVSTSMKNIKALKDKIKMYIEVNRHHWVSDHRVVVLNIENVDKMKMALYVTHNMKHQNMDERINRKSDLIFELKRLFEKLSIKYHLLPQEVLVTIVGSATTAPVTIRR